MNFDSSKLSSPQTSDEPIALTKEPSQQTQVSIEGITNQSENKIAWVAVDLLASQQELINFMR